MAGGREGPAHVCRYELRVSAARGHCHQPDRRRIRHAEAGSAAAVDDRRIREGGGDAGGQGWLQQLRLSPLTAINTHADGPALRGAVASWPMVKVLGCAIALVVAMLVALPLASLARFALAGDAALWPHLAAYVLPVASVQT